MTERMQQETPDPLQATKDRLEGEIQEAVDLLRDALVEEQSDLHTLQYRLATEGAFASTEDITHRNLRDMRTDLSTLLESYCLMCSALGVPPKAFFPRSEQQQQQQQQPAGGVKDNVIVLRL